MSSPMDDSIDVGAVREGAADYSASPYAHVEEVEEPARGHGDSPSVTISISPEAKAAMEAGRPDPAETRRKAMQDAKAIAAAAGITEAQAVQAIQPSRDPPAAKGAALFQANLTSEKSSG